MQIARRQQQGSVPIDNPPSRVAKERAIRIAVECNPQIKGALTLGNGLGHGFRIQSSTIVVDVFPVRTSAHECRLHAATAEQFRRFSSSRAVCAVDQHAQPGQIGVDVRRQPFHVSAAKPSRARQAGCTLTRANLRFRTLQKGKNLLFDGRFMRIWEFVTVSGKNLDPIICPGIV